MTSEGVPTSEAEAGRRITTVRFTCLTRRDAHHIKVISHHIKALFHHVKAFSHHIKAFPHHIEDFSHHIEAFSHHTKIFHSFLASRESHSTNAPACPKATTFTEAPRLTFREHSVNIQ
jgi:hypothetical protein